MTHWFTRMWWSYVLTDHHVRKDYANYWQRCLCRARGHRGYGVVWHSHGLEPDMTCLGCGEDLG
jgi:hypothetical protein